MTVKDEAYWAATPHKCIATAGGGFRVELNEAELQEIAERERSWEAEQKATEWLRGRKAAYPSIEDQLDALYHKGLDGWKADIKAIKEQFPKPVA